MATSVLQSVNSIQQFQNYSDPCQIDSRVVSQALNHAYSTQSDGIQHDLGAGPFRRFEQPKLHKPLYDSWMQSETLGSVFQRHQIASSSNHGNFVFCCFHFLPSMK